MSLLHSPKELLEEKNLLDERYRFEHEREQEALRSSCKENEIRLSD
jgi:hypothetical protein